MQKSLPRTQTELLVLIGKMPDIRIPIDTSFILKELEKQEYIKIDNPAVRYFPLLNQNKALSSKRRRGEDDSTDMFATFQMCHDFQMDLGDGHDWTQDPTLHSTCKLPKQEDVRVFPANAFSWTM
jgi:hypothetical protein